MGWIVELIDQVLSSAAKGEGLEAKVIASVREEVNREMMKHPLFAW